MDIYSDKSLTVLIKEKARELGFDLCGIANSRDLAEHIPVIQTWCDSGMNADMSYLGRNVEKRIDPGLLFSGAKSVLVTGTNYYTDNIQSGDDVPIISRHAYGRDYHYVIKERLLNLLAYIKSIRSDTEGKLFVDTSPIIEKAWAREAGLGWIGRNSILINKNLGSFLFLGGILLNLELEYDEPCNDNKCGSCRLCIDSCPTGAINENRTIDARKCLSYLTIEYKSPVPDKFGKKAERRIFGCDRCQEVCPWNKNAKTHCVSEFELPEELKKMTLDDWKDLNVEQFNKYFVKSAIERRGYKILSENIRIITEHDSTDT